MLCPECGTSVGGDSVRRCAGCEARAQEREAERQRQLEEMAPRAKKKIERAEVRASQPDLVNDHGDPELQLMAFFSSKLGIALISTTIFMICLVVMVIAVPGHGVIGSALLTLMISGVAISAAGPYAFGFSSRITRYIARAVGLGITLVGALSYSAYTGKPLSESYEVVRHILEDDESGTASYSYTDESSSSYEEEE